MKTTSKNFLFISFLILLFSVSTAQDINPLLYEKAWLDNETRLINGFAITKIFGQMPHAPSAYNFMPITSVAYTNLEGLKIALKKAAEANGLDDAEYTKQNNLLDQQARGGMIEFYISRYVEEQANFKYFFVILRGEIDDEKLWEHDLGYQAPEMPYERGWWNYKTLEVPVKIEPPFYIYLNDKSSRYLSDFKFKVEVAPADDANE